MLHRARQLLIKQQTMSVNALRGHLAEFGIVASKGIGRVDELVEKAENDATLPSAATAALKLFVQHLAQSAPLLPISTAGYRALMRKTGPVNYWREFPALER